MKITSLQKSLLFAFFLFGSLAAHAQNTRSFFSLTGGYSLPVGEMAKEKLNDPFTGLAGSGYYGQANYDFRIARWLGLRASASLNENKTNSQPIIDKANSYASILGEDYNWQADVSRWKLAAAMLGPALYINMNRAQIELHAQVGKVWANSPSVSVVGTPGDGGQPVNVSLNSAMTSAWGLGGGMSLRLPIVGSLFFQLSGDVVGAEAELKDIRIRAVRGNIDFSEKISEKRFVGVVNVGAGLGIAF